MPTAADFEHLPVSEKLQLVTELWDQIARSREPIRLPESAIAEARRRQDEMLADPSIGITEDEMWRRVDAKS